MSSSVLTSTFLNNGVQVQLYHQIPMITTKYTTKKYLKNISCSSKNSCIATAFIVSSTLAAPFAGLAVDINNIPPPPQPQLIQTQTRTDHNFPNTITLNSPNLTAVIGEGKLIGGWEKIDNLSDQEVIDTAEFALAEHNKKTGSELLFVKVLEGEKQLVNGLNYRLVVQAHEHGKRLDNFKVQVYESFKNDWELTDFTPLLT